MRDKLTILFGKFCEIRKQKDSFIKPYLVENNRKMTPQEFSRYESLCKKEEKLLKFMNATFKNKIRA